MPEPLRHDDWIVPAWPTPAGVRALITTRAGGVSTGPYASFNLGLSTADDPSAVRANREHLLGVLPAEPRWLKQVHGARVIEAEARLNERQGADAEVDERPQADAQITRARGTVCAVLIADCLPVLLTDRAGTIVGAAHAGWRGLAAGVIGNTVSAMTRHGVPPGDLLAYIGPGIGPLAFEVGDDVYQAFVSGDKDARAAFTRTAHDKWLANLVLLARRALARAGVTQVFGDDLCTYSDPQRFFSHRRDKVTGRMGAFIWRL
jgi:YfiH family protein